MIYDFQPLSGTIIVRRSMKTLGCHTLCYRNATLAAKAMFAAYNQRDAANHTHTHTHLPIYLLYGCCHTVRQCHAAMVAHALLLVSTTQTWDCTDRCLSGFLACVSLHVLGIS